MHILYPMIVLGDILYVGWDAGKKEDIFKQAIFNNKSVRIVHEMPDLWTALLKNVVLICSCDYGLIFQVLSELNFVRLPLDLIYRFWNVISNAIFFW